jgi:hypothetical protein
LHEDPDFADVLDDVRDTRAEREELVEPAIPEDPLEV